jgi:hypothetical protein
VIRQYLFDEPLSNATNYYWYRLGALYRQRAHGWCREIEIFTAGVYFGNQSETERLTGQGTSSIQPINKCAEVAQLVRASPCHGEGRGFEPRLSRHLFNEKSHSFGDGFFVLKSSDSDNWKPCEACCTALRTPLIRHRAFKNMPC